MEAQPRRFRPEFAVIVGGVISLTAPIRRRRMQRIDHCLPIRCR
jgi:hypothetical protein